MLLLGCYAEIARPRSAPISPTLNTGRNDRRESQPSKRSQFDGRKFERSRKSSIPGISPPFVRSTLDFRYSRSLALSFRSRLAAPSRIPFGFLRHDFQFQFRIDRSVARSPMLEAPRPSSSLPLLPLSISLSFSLNLQSIFSCIDPIFPDRYGQFNTGLPSTSPCQIGGRPLFQCLSWDKGQNRFLKAPQSGSCGRYSNRGGS